MRKFMTGSALAVAVVLFAPAAFAQHQVTSIVGYTKTETILNDRDAEFHRIDTSADGAINFKEFQRSAQLDNEYEMFNMNDTNNDELLTIDEYRVFSKSGPAQVSEGSTGTHYSFNKSGVNK